MIPSRPAMGRSQSDQDLSTSSQLESTTPNAKPRGTLRTECPSSEIGGGGGGGDGHPVAKKRTRFIVLNLPSDLPHSSANRTPLSTPINKLRSVRMPTLAYVYQPLTFHTHVLSAANVHIPYDRPLITASCRRRRDRTTVNELDEMAKERGHAAAEERFIDDLKQQIADLKASLTAAEQEVDPLRAPLRAERCNGLTSDSRADIPCLSDSRPKSSRLGRGSAGKIQCSRGRRCTRRPV
jgi:hypothetical protein